MTRLEAHDLKTANRNADNRQKRIEMLLEILGNQKDGWKLIAEYRDRAKNI